MALWRLKSVDGTKEKTFKSERQAKKYSEQHEEYSVMTSERQSDDNILQVKITATWNAQTSKPEIVIEKNYVNRAFEVELFYSEDENEQKKIIMYKYYDIEDNFDTTEESIIKNIMQEICQDTKQTKKHDRRFAVSHFVDEKINADFTKRIKEQDKRIKGNRK